MNRTRWSLLSCAWSPQGSCPELTRYRKLFTEVDYLCCQLSGMFATLTPDAWCGPLCWSHTTYRASSSICAFFQFNITSFPTPVLPVSLMYLSQPQDPFLLGPHHIVSTMMKFLKPLKWQFLIIFCEHCLFNSCSISLDDSKNSSLYSQPALLSLL